jgi:hypothetical protein
MAAGASSLASAAALPFLPRFGFGSSSSSADFFVLFAQTSMEPDFKCFSSRYGPPHSGHFSATGLYADVKSHFG